ncbi:MAG: acyltransferase [Niastella sp.]|nr:acyltransferase [Niastella sp.]
MPFSTLVAHLVQRPAVEHTGLSRENARFNALTGFRCLAACLVFVYHNRKYWRSQLHPEILRFINELHIGVSLFFVLSGFLIAYTYGEKPLRSYGSYGKYILLRIARIMPLYWLILTCYYLDHPYGKGAFTWLTYSLAHAFSNAHNLDGLAQAWSLNMEMIFYLLAPLLCMLQRKHVIYLLAFLVALFFLAWGVGYTWFKINGNPQKYLYPINFLLHSTFFGRCSEFLAGMLLASIWKSGSLTLLKQLPHKTLIGFTGIFITSYAIGLFQKNTYVHGTDTIPGLVTSLLVLPAFTIIVFAGLMQERNLVQRFFASRVMVLLGNASFAFYLIHISYVNMKIKSWVLLPDRNFILLWIAAIILYLFVEKPTYQLCRRWLSRGANRSKNQTPLLATTHSTPHVH